MVKTKPAFTLRTILTTVLVVFILPFLPMILSGQWRWWEAWMYSLLNITGFLASRIWAARRHPDILEEVRGIGLHIGLKCKVENTLLHNKLLDHGVLTAKGGDNVIRLLPPLIVGEAEISEFIDRLDAACTELENE